MFISWQNLRNWADSIIMVVIQLNIFPRIRFVFMEIYTSFYANRQGFQELTLYEKSPKFLQLITCKF